MKSFPKSKVPKQTIIVIAIIIIVAIASIASLIYYYGKPLATLTDDAGFTLNLTSYPQKIVSLAPSNTQILFAVGAGEKVVGVTDYDFYPYNFSAWVAAGNMSSIGSYYNPEIERIMALHPDLIVASLGSKNVAGQLRDMGYNVLLINPKNLTGIMNDVILVGKATNHEDQAITVVADMQKRINAVVNAVANASYKPKVYVEVYNDPYYSAGQGSFINDLITLAGGQNIFESRQSDYFQINDVEEIIGPNPDIIIFPSSMGVNFWGNYSTVAARPGWGSINAIKNNKMYTVLGDMINQPAPRQIDALEALAKIIHPEIFGNYTDYQS